MLGWSDKVCSRKEANLTKLRPESLARKRGGENRIPPPSSVHIGDLELEGGLVEWPKVAEGGRVGVRNMAARGN